MECGFCEPVCPSRNATTTPRQRIVIRREMARQPEGSPVYEALLADYEYDALQTCAADGSCERVCPVAIDTGKLVKQLRTRERSEREQAVALALARRYAVVERAARGGLAAAQAAAQALGERRLAAGSGGGQRACQQRVHSHPARGVASKGLRSSTQHRASGCRSGLPPGLHQPHLRQPSRQRAGTVASAGAREHLRARGAAGWIPDDAAGHCCAMPWGSKGYERGQRYMAAKTAAAMWRWSEGARLPVVIDASSCAQGLLVDVAPSLSEGERERFEQIEVLDSIAWAHDRLLPRLQIERKLERVAVHPTCSATQLGLASKLQALAGALANEVVVPASSGCCGMAGDRGLLHPELPASALRDLPGELSGQQLDGHLSSNRTCEIALQEVTGAPYASFVLLLERLTRAGG